jgi:D-amino-acid dehydrogenase
MHVVVIGAGIIGAASALELLRDGHRVTIVEPGDPGGEQAASYGNGCLLTAVSVLPVSEPGMWKKVPGYLADPLGPLAVRWSYLPKVAPWLLRFLRAGSNYNKLRVIARGLKPLVHQSPERHRKLAEEAGVGDLIHKNGVLNVYLSREEFEAEAEAWAIKRENGITWIELNADELRQKEPSIDRRYQFGVLFEQSGHCTDPGAYVAALVHHAEALGAKLVRARALGFDLDGRRLKAVRTDGGKIACERAVIAAGARSREFARQVGDNVALETQRGYHAVISNPEAGPRIPIMPSDGHMSNVVTPHGLRLAGQLEIAGLDAAPNWKRAEILRDFALRTYPGLPRDMPAERVKFWMGHRPATPDSLPCIGPATGCPDVVHAYGHGMLGLATGAVTGRLVADIVSGKPPSIDPVPYNPARFN